MLAFSTSVPNLFSPRRGRPVPEPRRGRAAKYATSRRTVPNALAKKPSTKPYSGDDNDYMTPVYGMKLPDLSPEDRAYLSEAKSERDYMKRMTQLAHRMDQKRQAEIVQKSLQTPDAYIDSLSKFAKDRDESGNQSGDDDIIDDEVVDDDAVGDDVVDDDAVGDDVVDDELSSAPTRPPPVAEVMEPQIKTEEAVEVNNVAEVEENLEDVEARIQALNEKLMEAVDQNEQMGAEALGDSEREIEYSDEIAAEAQRKMETLRKEIHEEIGTEPPSMSPSKAKASKQSSKPAKTEAPVEMPVGSNPKVVDRQIAYLESYVSRLKRDAEEDGDAEKLAQLEKGNSEGKAPAERVDANVEDARTGDAQKQLENTEDVDKNVRFEGLENTSGGMSASEKQAVFEALRQRAMERKADKSSESESESEFADPFNVTLPEKRSSGVGGDFQGPETISEDYAGANEYDSFDSIVGDRKLVVEEIESEVNSYIAEAKRHLRAHEARMALLVTRLRAAGLDDN